MNLAELKIPVDLKLVPYIMPENNLINLSFFQFSIMFGFSTILLKEIC